MNRKAERWAAKIRQMPPAERKAVMLRLIDAIRG